MRISKDSLDGGLIHAFAVVCNLEDQVSFLNGSGDGYPSQAVAKVVKTVGDAVLNNGLQNQLGNFAVQNPGTKFMSTSKLSM